jgi:hypothetical protein
MKLSAALPRLDGHDIPVSGFSVAVGVAAFLAAVSQRWRTDPPLVAIFLLVIETSLVARPLFTRTA